jgi:NAD(P)-dependent dehydrogenase (short-subunit alcohol dehydrogenase family)
MARQKTIVITGASKGIGAGLVETFIGRGYNVVATSRSVTRNGTFQENNKLALVDGDVADPLTAERVEQAAIARFGSIDGLVNNAGIFLTKPFLDFTLEDFRKLIAVNVEGFIHLTKVAVRQMLKQGTGGSVVSITTSLTDHPIAGVNASLPMITKGGLNSVSKSLAMEFAQQKIRFNTVAPGIVETPMHEHDPKDFLRSLSPMGEISSVRDIVDAVMFLTEARHVTGEVLHIDGGAHLGKW